jgi:hypothetical protein
MKASFFLLKHGKKKIELSSLRSQSPRMRRMRSLSSKKWTSVHLQHASRREMSSIRTIQHSISSFSRTKSFIVNGDIGTSVYAFRMRLA